MSSSYNIGDALPINWRLGPDNHPDNRQCPEGWRILVTFAVSSAVVTLFSVALGHRGVVQTVTAGLLGRRHERKPSVVAKIIFAVQFILPVAIQLCGNLVVVKLIFSAPGYTEGADLGLTTFFFLFAARPRHTWMALSLLAHVPRTPLFPDEYPWRVAAASNAFCETLLQVLGLFTLGGIAHFGDQRGYGQVWSGEYGQLPQAARVMYAGAFLYVVMGVFGMIPLAVVWFGVFTEFCRGDALVADTVKGLGHKETNSYRSSLAAFTVGCLFCSWLASWLFWAGYVQLTTGERNL